jgi:hypothetical protein
VPKIAGNRDFWSALQWDFSQNWNFGGPYLEYGVELEGPVWLVGCPYDTSSKKHYGQKSHPGTPADPHFDPKITIFSNTAGSWGPGPLPPKTASQGLKMVHWHPWVVCVTFWRFLKISIFWPKMTPWALKSRHFWPQNHDFLEYGGELGAGAPATQNRVSGPKNGPLTPLGGLCHFLEIFENFDFLTQIPPHGPPHGPGGGLKNSLKSRFWSYLGNPGELSQTVCCVG